MHYHLPLGLYITNQTVRIQVTGQQQELEKEQRCAPHGGRSTKPGQDEFGDHRLDLEQEKSAQEDGSRVNKHGPSSIP